jgi:hypothetical protein
MVQQEERKVVRLTREREAILRGEKIPDFSPSQVVIAWLCAGLDLARDGCLEESVSGVIVSEKGRAELFRRLSLKWLRRQERT